MSFDGSSKSSDSSTSSRGSTRAEPSLDSDQSLAAYLREHRNWGRWGQDDQRGAMNLLTPGKLIEAASCVRTGNSISLSRTFPSTAGPQNPRPAQHHLGTWTLPGGAGIAHDYLGISYHGMNATHVDALCHVWDSEGMWGGRSPERVFGDDGATFGDIDQWKDGIVTRGVLFDVPRHRGTPFVAEGQPVTAEELEDIADANGVEVRAGDALVVHSGRGPWEATLDPQRPIPEDGRPGLHASCLQFMRAHDIALLVWDLMEEKPTGFSLPFTVHAALMAFGVGLVDNARLGELSDACADAEQTDFLLVVAPLRVVGGTGSPVNPIAVL